VTVPSPGAIAGGDGKPMPASYLNFYVSNTSVLVPTYGCAYDDEAVAVLARCFPGRSVLGSPARAILSGGGSISLHHPARAASVHLGMTRDG
jgi:agmatine deiminase